MKKVKGKGKGIDSGEKLNKEYQEEEQQEEEQEEEEQEDESKGCTAKSEDLSEDDLGKSLAMLTAYHEQGDTPTRKQSLLEKAQKEELTKSEQDELHQILGGGQLDHEDTLADQIGKSMDPGEDLQKALDVSDYLRETHDQIVEVSTKLADTIEKSDNRQHEFNMLLAKSTALIGNLVKSMDDRLEGLEGQPSRRPKSQAVPLQKSFAGAPPMGTQLSKSEILNTLGELIEKSCESNEGGVVNDINLVMETTKYEQTGQISPGALNLVKQQRNAVH